MERSSSQSGPRKAGSEMAAERSRPSTKTFSMEILAIWMSFAVVIVELDWNQGSGKLAPKTAFCQDGEEGPTGGSRKVCMEAVRVEV